MLTYNVYSKLPEKERYKRSKFVMKRENQLTAYNQ